MGRSISPPPAACPRPPSAPLPAPALAGSSSTGSACSPLRHRRNMSPVRLFFCGGRPILSVLREGTLFLYAGPESTRQERQAAVKSWYREQLLSAIPSVRQACEAIVGQRAAEVRVRDMRTRWGTCSVARRRIWLSLQLVQKPPACLRCVMTHELIHLLEPSHSPRFWTLMDRFCPDWREVHRLLGGPHAK